MTKTIIVGGYGPGISSAVAETFGSRGFSVALVARNAERLAQGVQALAAQGVTAAAFPTDLGSPVAIQSLVGKVREQFGAIDALHWNAYPTSAGDLLAADAAELHGVFDVAVVGLLTAVQETLSDLKQQKGAVLVTNGGLLYDDASVDEMAVQWGAMGLAVSNAAKHKVVGLLAQKLKADGVYVGEVIVTGTVKGTAFDNGSATLNAADIAQKFWDLYSERRATVAKI